MSNEFYFLVLSFYIINNAVLAITLDSIKPKINLWRLLMALIANAMSGIVVYYFFDYHLRFFALFCGFFLQLSWALLLLKKKALIISLSYWASFIIFSLVYLLAWATSAFHMH